LYSKSIAVYFAAADTVAISKPVRDYESKSTCFTKPISDRQRQRDIVVYTKLNAYCLPNSVCQSNAVCINNNDT
jgi:hypothetical protein